MPEYFIHASSFAAPFCSDDSTAYETANSPELALTQFAASYSHPAGLYAAECYASAGDMHKGHPALKTWRCNHALELDLATKDKGCFTLLVHSPGKFEVDGVLHEIPDPKGGVLV